ncbi:DUF4031 domain-containing protein [Pseudarthrobacter sp. J1763]|uniref:DUF4031 domain-containing protein n=1 Tax=Pseudarthrobacter sp. J1763 TaxID=3420445 RepID=UPI003D2B1E77
MALLIDPPLWPAHGTVFSHLVSDASLAELHAFAAAAGIPERAFDGDHYDVPLSRYQDLIAAGALPVDGRTLVRRLVASGLRIPARERNKAVVLALTHRWDALLPECTELRQELLERWGEEHRRYHNRAHLLAVLEGLDLLCTPEPAPRTVALAAWFHDAVYNGVAGQDEEDSAALAEDRLSALVEVVTPHDVAEVARLVRLTANHRPESSDAAGQLLCDADLAVLARHPAAYERYATAVRHEYPHVSDADFAKGRAAVVRQLLALEPLFHTQRARELWLDDARRNLSNELATLA